MHLGARTLELDVADLPAEFRIEFRWVNEPGKGSLGVDVGNDPLGSYLFAALEHHTRCPAALDDDPLNRGVRLDCRAALSRSRGQRSRQAPDPPAHAHGRPENAAVHPHVVVQEGVRGAGGHRSLKHAGNGGSAECTLQHVALEPVVQQLLHRHGQDAHHFNHVPFAQASQPAAQAKHRPEISHATGDDIGRRGRVRSPQQACSLRHELSEGNPLVGVCLRELADRLDAALGVAPQQEMTPVEEWSEHRWIGLDDVQPVTAQIQLSNHGGV